MIECKEVAGRVVRLVSLYEEGPYGSEVSIDFEDGSNLTVTLLSRLTLQGKLTRDEGGEPILLRKYEVSTP